MMQNRADNIENRLRAFTGAVYPFLLAIMSNTSQIAMDTK
jgi:hypothetical protein